jgi:CBS domain-containing protein
MVLDTGGAIAFIPFLVSSYFWLNWLLGVFNLFIPAIPLDGGRVFRSMLAMGMKYVDATKVATRVSRIVTIFLFLFAFLTYNLILMVISVFIWLGSAAEMEFALSDELLAGVPLANVLRKNYLLVDDDDSIDMVVEDMITSRSLVALIELDGHIGTTSLYDIRHVPKSKWKSTKIGRVARKLRPISVNHSIMDALKKMNKDQVDALPVTYKNRLKGVVFRDDILKVFEILKVVNE